MGEGIYFKPFVYKTSHPASHHMSHCILKTSPPPAKSILMDAVDSVELFCYWLKDSVQWGRTGKKDDKAMSVLEYRTGDVKVHHATDDDDDDCDDAYYNLYKKKKSSNTLQS